MGWRRRRLVCSTDSATARLLAACPGQPVALSGRETGNAGTSDATSPATVAAHATDRPGALRELLSAVTSAFESGPERGVDGVGEARIWQVGGATLQRWYPMIADVRRGLDQLVEQSTLYVVDERGGRQRLFRPTEMRAEIAPAPAVSRVEDAVHDGKRSRRGCQ